MKFTKLEGAGNDYIYIDAINDLPENLADSSNFYRELAVKISDRHFGVGSDGVIAILPPDIDRKNADFRMRMFNADGSEGEMCGNGIRCFAKYVYDHKLISKNQIKINTLAGIKTVKVFTGSGADGSSNGADLVEYAAVEMGKPEFESAKISVDIDKPEVIGEIIKAGDSEFKINCVSMGNPHCVIFVNDVDNFNVGYYGPLIENNTLFPKRINVEFTEIISNESVKVRTWERGSGETLACGTGACAVYSVIKKTIGINGAGGINNNSSISINSSNNSDSCANNADSLNVILRGGVLQIAGDINKSVLMTGPAKEVFSGYYDFEF
ncbi:MAG: diaminopimelate epimerase [Candidatus Acididesulfobacter guangdongensis]|uniref:Diaminopimelate epimerase n=1 Tax=Acididesulfobacter guangdongensis TaxID=2597225 RepID=A0A519BHA8_ACIG2|nr:MAG: diaminopimelate epimerase [Candidatus Acididesulfobacter guangdongensis]